MPFNVNHIHLKSSDPKATADWFVEAFNVEIKTDNVRPVGDRFITTMTEGGLAINISSERTDEKLGPAPHWWAYGDVSIIGRYWTYINDQPANCWN